MIKSRICVMTGESISGKEGINPRGLMKKRSL